MFRELLACLPADEYRVAALVHPNIWHGHGPWQLHTWLADCTRAGLIIAPPIDGWQATLIASDLVVGDHGATTCYGGAVGRPVLLAAFPDEDVAPGSAIDLLGRTTPRLDRHRPLRSQIDHSIGHHTADAYADVRALVSSCPGESAARLRQLFYGHLRLAEPVGEPPVPVVPVASVSFLPRPYAHADHVVCVIGDDDSPTTFTRYPADVAVDRAGAGYLDAAHLVAHEDHPNQSLLDEAAVILVTLADHQDTRAALADALRRHPGADLAATTSTEACVVQTREGAQVILRGGDSRVGASYVYAWLLANRPLGVLPPVIRIVVGPTEITLRLVSVAVEETP